MTRVLIVGAGSAGSVLADRSSSDPALEVLLLEAGKDRTPTTREPNIRSVNMLDAFEQNDAFWSGVRASWRPGEDYADYWLGRGVGGSAAVNAMIALPGVPSDYDRWRDQFGCEGWGWEDVSPVFQDLFPQLRRVAADEFTPLDTAVLGAAERLGLRSDLDFRSESSDGAGPLWLASNGRRRNSSPEVFLDPARGRPNLTVRADTEVAALSFNADRSKVSGVVLVDGSTIEADQIVLAAGAFGSPAILLRSGLTRRGIGQNLKDHAAATAYLRLGDQVATEDRKLQCIGSVLRWSSSRGPSDLLLMPLHGRLPASPEGANGLVSLCLMTAQSTGSLTVDSAGRISAQLNQLTEESDRQTFAEGMRRLGEILQAPAFRDTVERYWIGDSSDPDELNAPEFLEHWITGGLGGLVHAVGTCRMGDPADEDAVVDTSGAYIGIAGLSIADASVMPDVPSANTHLPTVMVARRLADAIAGRIA